MSETELRLLQRRAGIAGVDRSTLLREAALGYRSRRSIAPAVNVEVVGELNAIGNNLNQLVKLTHQGRAPLGLQSLLEQLLSKIHFFRRALLGLKSPGDREGN